MSNKPLTLMNKICDDYDADLVFFFGPVMRPKDDFLIEECPKKHRRKNVILMIATLGGDANAAYRITRTFQNNYKDGKFYAFVPSVCASAGTLLISGCDTLILTDHAELGPIDVQLVKADEIGERTSGLTPIHALEYLQTHAAEFFENQFSNLRFVRRFSTTVAAKIATDITTGLLGHLYDQIDPIRLAEVNRFLRVAQDYGTRIGRNLKDGALDRLLSEYKSHDFVIDPVEAVEIFKEIEPPKPSLADLGVLLKPKMTEFLYGDSAHVAYFEPPAPTKTPSNSSTSPDHEQNSNNHSNAKANGRKAVGKKAGQRSTSPVEGK